MRSSQDASGEPGCPHIVKRRAQLVGLEGDFGGHSLRSGSVTEARRQNVAMGDAMALTGASELCVTAPIWK